MKGLIFTALGFLILLALYFKFVHPRITGATEEKSYGYDEDYGYDDEA